MGTALVDCNVEKKLHGNMKYDRFGLCQRLTMLAACLLAGSGNYSHCSRMSTGNSAPQAVGAPGMTRIMVRNTSLAAGVFLDKFRLYIIWEAGDTSAAGAQAAEGTRLKLYCKLIKLPRSLMSSSTSQARPCCKQHPPDKSEQKAQLVDSETINFYSGRNYIT